MYGFPKDEALNIALSEIGRFLLTHDMTVILVVFERTAFELSEKLVGEIEAFIDDHGVDAAGRAEYGAFPAREERRRRQAAIRPQVVESECRDEMPSFSLDYDETMPATPRQELWRRKRRWRKCSKSLKIPSSKGFFI